MQNNLPGWFRKNVELAAICVIVGFFVLFFWPLLFGNKYFVTSDAFFYSYPLRTLAWTAIRQHTLPLWTPFLMGGYPLISMSQIALLYPLTWGYAVMAGYKAEVIYVLAPFVLSPTFTYFYARQIGRSRLASLLAGLAFGYGGMMAGMLANSGYTTNSVMWLPLMLVGVERTRTHTFAHGLLWTTGAYALCVFNGHGQTFVNVGLIALAYALFVVLFIGRDLFVGWRRIKPVIAVLIALGTAAGISAFQILETLRATDLSIRRALSYEVFVEGSFQLQAMVLSAVLPLHYDLEVTTYVSPLAIVLAACAVFRFSRSDMRIVFWILLAAAGCVLMLGSNTPVYKLIYHVPVLNRFRVPARHSFEWTLSIAVLAAYGWDAIFRQIKHSAARRHYSWIVLALIAITAIIGSAWFNAVHGSSEPMFYARTGYPIPRYLIWKAGFFLTLFVAAWLARNVVRVPPRSALLGAIILFACFPEPYMLISRWWFTAAKPEERFSVSAASTNFVHQYQSERTRVYSRVNLFVEENVLHPTVDALNLTAIFQLHNVAGYEPLILERYSRALGNVGYDSVNPRPGFARDSSILDSRSHVLDILNTRFLVAYANPLYAEGTVVRTKDGIRVADTDDPANIKPGEIATLLVNPTDADVLALVTSLSNGAGEADGQTTAKLRITTVDGRTVEHDFRAGIETAEWAHERPDVRSIVKHGLPEVFSSRPGDEEQSFQALNYWSRISLGQRLRIRKLEIVNMSSTATLVVWKGSFYDSGTNYSVPFTNSLLDLQPYRWHVTERTSDRPVEKEGITFRTGEPLEIRPGQSLIATEVDAQADTLGLVTSMSHAANEIQGNVIARVRLTSSDGEVIERELRAGIDTAEWSHERPDVRSVVRHQLAPAFDWREEPEPSFKSYRYFAKLNLPKSARIKKVEVTNTSAEASLTVWQPVLFDSIAKAAVPLPLAEPAKWHTVYTHDNVLVLENSERLPRAWLVGEVRTVDSDAALRAIRGDEGLGFDPKRTALVESADVPPLDGRSPSSTARADVIAYEANRLTIKTTSDAAAILVVSEVMYPGWHATVDGSPVPIFTTNYLLRGVAVPAGSHSVEMRYAAPGARTGLFISLSTLLVFSGLWITVRRMRW